MKSIEEIEMMSDEQLRALSEDTSVKVPEGLRERLENTVTATAMSEQGEQEKRRRMSPWFAAGPAVLVAASLTLIITLSKEPKDTFSDPMLAYAEVEKTFAYMSTKVSRGLEIASESEPVIERTSEMINNITE